MFLRLLSDFGRSSLPASPHFGLLSRQPVWILWPLASPTASMRETGAGGELSRVGTQAGVTVFHHILRDYIHPSCHGTQVKRCNPRRGTPQGESTGKGAWPSRRLPACGRDHKQGAGRCLPAPGPPGRGQECLWSLGSCPPHGEEQHLGSPGWSVPGAVSSLLSSLFCRKSEPECPGWQSPCLLEGGGLRPRRPQGACGWLS